MNHQAIYNTHPEVKTIIDNEDNTVTCYDANGNIVNINKADIEAKMVELQAEYDANQYQRDRVYPAIGDQLDMLWHSIDKDPELKSKYFEFYEAIKAVKIKHPKNG